MATGHPHLLSIGDWVMAGGSKYFGADEPSTPFEVCEVTGIVEREPGHYDIHLAGVEHNEPVQNFYRLHMIRICDETLQEFGFEPCDGEPYIDYLYETHRWRLDCREIEYPDLDYFYISWEEDEDGCRSYRIICRGYGEDMVLLEDTISELQHFFFRYNGEFPMPMKYHGRSHFGPIKKLSLESVGIMFDAFGVDERIGIKQNKRNGYGHQTAT